MLINYNTNYADDSDDDYQAFNNVANDDANDFNVDGDRDGVDVYGVDGHGNAAADDGDKASNGNDASDGDDDGDADSDDDKENVIKMELLIKKYYTNYRLLESPFLSTI